jgi:hypothetical protein
MHCHTESGPSDVPPSMVHSAELNLTYYPHTETIWDFHIGRNMIFSPHKLWNYQLGVRTDRSKLWCLRTLWRFLATIGIRIGSDPGHLACHTSRDFRRHDSETYHKERYDGLLRDTEQVTLLTVTSVKKWSRSAKLKITEAI